MGTCVYWAERVGCFFFQAEDGIRDRDVTGVQTCALPIFDSATYDITAWSIPYVYGVNAWATKDKLSLNAYPATQAITPRSEERRVGKECRAGWVCERCKKRWLCCSCNCLSCRHSI